MTIFSPLKYLVPLIKISCPGLELFLDSIMYLVRKYIVISSSVLYKYLKKKTVTLNFVGQCSYLPHFCIYIFLYPSNISLVFFLALFLMRISSINDLVYLCLYFLSTYSINFQKELLYFKKYL